MSEPVTDKEDPPAPTAPNLGELFELALTALVNAPGVFARLEARPIPGPGVSLLVALAWGALYFAVNLIHMALASPAALQSYAPWQIGGVAFFGLCLWAALYLLGASCVYGVGRMLGSAGDFDRALLVATLTLTAAPAQALCSWFPMAWVAPTLLAAWITACGLTAMFKADAWAARGVTAVLAAGVLMLQYGAGLAVDKYGAAAQLAAVAAQSTPSPDQLLELQQQMQQLQETVQDSASVNPPGPSSLDLLRGPGADAPQPTGPTSQQQLAQMNAAGDAMNKSVLSMLTTMAPMLDNPQITQNMTLQQKSEYNELKQMIKELKNDMASNKVTSSEDQQAKMLKIQGLMMRMLSSGMSMPKSTLPEQGIKK